MKPATFVMLVALSAFACSKAPPEETPKAAAPAAKFGEPVGLKVASAKDVPAFEVALAVTKGRDPDALVSPLAFALSKALAACPMLVEESRTSGVTSLEFEVEQGKAKVHKAPSPTVGATCLSAALEGKALEKDTFARLDARAEIRFPTDKDSPALQ